MDAPVVIAVLLVGHTLYWLTNFLLTPAYVSHETQSKHAAIINNQYQ